MTAFGSAIGGGGALQAALARRGISASVLDQQSPASAGGAPDMPPAIPTTNPSVGSIPQEAVAPPKEDTDLRIALNALTKFVGSESNLKKSVIDMRSQGLI